MNTDTSSGGLPCPQEELSRLFELAQSPDEAVAREAQGKLFVCLAAMEEKYIRRHARQDWGNRLSTSDLAQTVIREMQEGFEEAMRAKKYESFEHLRRVFLRRVADRARDHLRRCFRQRRAAEELGNPYPEEERRSDFKAMEAAEAAARAMSALWEHNPLWAEVVELRLLANDGGGSTFDEIARWLGMSKSTAHAHYRAALAWLAEQFSEFRPE